MIVKDINAKDKEQFFNTLFESRVIRYSSSTNGQLMNVSIKCTNPALNSYFSRLYAKFKVKTGWSDYLNECIFHTWSAINKFEIKDDGSWVQMIAGTDKANVGRLINNIKITVKNQIIRWVNGTSKFTKAEVDGKKSQHVIVNMKFDSFDVVLTGAEGAEETYLNMVSDEMSYWGNKNEAEYRLNHFIEWFKEAKHRVLTARQIKLLEDLSKAQRVEGYTVNDTYQITGVPSFKINTRLKSIKEKALAAWEKENPLGQKTFLQLEKEKELTLLSEWVMIALDFEIDNQNKQLSDWLVANAENEKIANLLYDNADVNESILITRLLNGKESSVLNGKLLYKIDKQINKRLDELALLDTSNKPVTKEFNTKQFEWNEQQEALKQQEVKVYDFEDNLLGVENWSPFKQPKNNLIEVLPSGIKITTSIN